MSLPNKTRRIRWDEGKADELWNFVQEETAKGNKVTAALREFAEDNGISWLTARWKYYRVKNERLDTERALESRSQDGDEMGAEDHDTAFSHLSAFLKYAQGTGLDLSGLLGGLHHLAKEAEAAQSLQREIEEKEKEMAALKQRFHALEGKMKEVKAQYQTLNYLINEWLNLQSVDRVTTMGDFGRKLQYQVDKFGTVIRLET